AIEERRLAVLHETEELKARRNAASEEIAAKKRAGEDAEAEIKAMREVAEREQLAAWIPNLPHPSVPPGSDATHNQQVRTWGAAPKFDFPPQAHWDLATKLGLLDFERAP